MFSRTKVSVQNDLYFAVLFVQKHRKLLTRQKTVQHFAMGVNPVPFDHFIVRFLACLMTMLNVEKALGDEPMEIYP